MIITKTYTVSMHCPSCEMLLEGLEDLPGVSDVHADYKAQKLEVTFDDAAITSEDIMAAVRKDDYEINDAEAPSN